MYKDGTGTAESYRPVIGAYNQYNQYGDVPIGCICCSRTHRLLNLYDYSNNWVADIVIDHM